MYQYLDGSVQSLGWKLYDFESDSHTQPDVSVDIIHNLSMVGSFYAEPVVDGLTRRAKCSIARFSAHLFLQCECTFPCNLAAVDMSIRGSPAIQVPWVFGVFQPSFPKLVLRLQATLIPNAYSHTLVTARKVLRDNVLRIGTFAVFHHALLRRSSLPSMGLAPVGAGPFLLQRR